MCIKYIPSDCSLFLTQHLFYTTLGPCLEQPSVLKVSHRKTQSGSKALKLATYDPLLCCIDLISSQGFLGIFFSDGLEQSLAVLFSL